MPVRVPQREDVRPAARGGDLPVSSAATVSVADGVTRFTLVLDRDVAATAFLLESPDRVILDLPEVEFRLPADAGRRAGDGAGLIRAFRFGRLAAGRSRVVLDLGRPAALRSTALASTRADGRSTLVVEVTDTDRAAFRAAVRRDEALAPPLPAAQPQAALDGRPVVILDPGHGGIDPGAAGLDGIVEKTVTFDFATALAARLERTGRYHAVLTRTGDNFVSLGDRVRIARAAGAGLLISIHADSLGDPNVTGATVYTVSDRASDAEAARLAAGENRADEIAGLVPAVEEAGVGDILFDLTRRETRTYSHFYQRTLVGYLQKIAHLNKNPQREAGFKVLRAPDVPSVLLELGYLSSRADARMLTSPVWRASAVDSVATSVDVFFQGRRPGSDQDAAAAPKIVAAQPHF